MSSSNASSSALPPPPPGFPQDYAPPTLSPLPRHFVLTLPYPGILNVCLNNKKLNPWSSPMTLEMTNIFKHVATDPEVSVIILSATSGAKAFCAGLDVTESHLGEMAASSDDPAHVAFKFRRHIQEFQASLTEMELCHKPVISAVHGVVFGLGVDLMCATDIRYADKDSRFCVKEVDIALAADIGSLQRLPKIVGNDSVVRELAFTAREFGSEEAQRIGFVGRVTEGGRDGVVGELIDGLKGRKRLRAADTILFLAFLLLQLPPCQQRCSSHPSLP